MPRSTLSRGDNISRTSASREAAVVAPRSNENRSSLRGSQSGSRNSTATAQAAGSTYSERSTLTSFRTGSTGSSTFRGTTSAHSSLGVRTTAYTQSHYSPGYYSSYYSPSYYSTGVGFSWYLGGGFSISFGTGWHGGWNWCGYPGHWGRHWGSNVYYGSFAMAYVVGSACHIVPYHGYWGYRHGTHCYWMPQHQYRRCHSFWYGGHYCRVSRPYWYDYWAWYDWRPYRYGYTTLVYDSLYDEGYDDGYGRGYNRGYEDGADDASGLRDDRRRDRIGGERARHPEPELDRARADASTEYRYQVEQGLAGVARGDHDAATRAFKEAAVLAPESADARYLLSVSAFAQGKYALSAFALRRAMKLDAAGRNLDLARIFGSPEAARTYRDRLQAELARHPDDEDLLLVQGFVSLRMGDAKAAAAALDAALRESPDDAAVKLLQKEALDALENE
ncbi:MAG: tetratricopeptide repeat protein [Planctomycetes bacterium]|nr:tetratricopeptide repeat protein [Planctomycetota bacterium]